MSQQDDQTKYIIMPDFGFRSPILAQSVQLRTVGQFQVSRRPSEAPETPRGIDVLHSMHEDGPKLVEMSKQTELDLRADIPGLKVVPLVRFKQMRMSPQVEKASTAVGATFVDVSVTERGTQMPIGNARVVAFTNFRHKVGAEAVSDASGLARLDLTPGTKLDRMYVFASRMHWNHLKTSFSLNAVNDFTLEAINLTANADALAAQYGGLPDDAGDDITVAVIDSGVQKDHPALPNVQGGRNLVLEELQADPSADIEWGPAATEGDHGTHVAGIVGMRRTAASQIRGVAPGVNIRSYRVFPNSGEGATNYDIINAIDMAVADGCQIINLSLGSGVADEATRSAIGDAAQKGVLVVAASGNDGRRAVSYPAAFPTCVAVSAMGIQGSFPNDSTESGDVAKPFGKLDNEFVAAFSNIGPQISFVGPGVGIVSTVPGSSWGVMSGTSMASPAIAGFAAHILSKRPDIKGMVGDTRTRTLRQAIEQAAKARGFGRDFEGFGLPQ